jgi:hypothetical protein
MKPTRRIILISLLALAVGGLAVYLLRPKEPSYQGKTVREWMAELSEGEVAKARQAFHVFGTNAIPIVVQELCVRDSKLTLAMHRLMARQSLIPFPFATAESRRDAAITAILFLSSEHAAQPAIALIVPHLRTGTDSDVRSSLFWVLGAIGLAAPEAVPFALAGLKDPNSDVRACALEFLARTHSQHAEFVPILLAKLRDQNEEVRYFIVERIGELENPSPSIVQAVRLAATNDSNPGVRKKAVKALGKWDAATAAKAGNK